MILLLLNPLLSQFPSMRTLLPLLMYGTCYASKSKGNPHCVIGIVTGENRGTESNSIGGSRHAFILLPYRQQHTHYHPTNHYHLGAYHTTQSTMLRTIQRRLPLSTLPRTPRALSAFPSKYLAKRSYASETSIPPSPNDDFASGGNAYYAEEYVQLWLLLRLADR